MSAVCNQANVTKVLCVMGWVLAGVGIINDAMPALGSLPEWEWQNPLPQGNNLMAVWSNGPNDVFAVGEAGTIIHYDGSTWSLMDSGTMTHVLSGVWGSGPNDIFAVGTYYDQPNWREYATILHYDGANWSTMISGLPNGLRGVWGSAPNDVFAVGPNAILHYNGATWSEMTNPVGYLNAVWGSGPNDVFAVGDDKIVHYDGTTWSEVCGLPIDPGSGWVWLSSVWGSGPNDVFVVGMKEVYDEGDFDRLDLILHFDGASWSEMPVPSSPYDSEVFSTVWGAGPDNVFAAGTHSRHVLHYDGSTWSYVPDVAISGCMGIRGSSASDVYAVGDAGRIALYDGSMWSLLSSGFTSQLCDIWGSGSNDVFAVGDGYWDEGNQVHCGATILHYDGSTWSPMNNGAMTALTRIWGSGPKNVFALSWLWWDDANETYYGTILHYDGSAWSEMENIPRLEFTDIWGSGPNDVYAVGWHGDYLHEIDQGVHAHPVLLHYDGSQWADATVPSEAHLRNIWGSGPNDVYFVGTEWSYDPNLFPSEIRKDQILHYDGSSWSISWESDPERTDLGGMWGSGPNDVYVVGTYHEWGETHAEDVDYGITLHFDGSTWSDVLRWPMASFGTIWGSGPNDIFVTGWTENGPSSLNFFVLHFDGVTWSPMPTGAATPLAIWGNGPDDVFAVGYHGAILHYPRQYKLTSGVNCGQWGSVTVEPNQVKYANGTQVTVTAYPADGFAFGTWVGDVPEANTSDNPLQITMDGNKTLSAIFYPPGGIDPNHIMWKLPGGEWRTCGAGSGGAAFVGAVLILCAGALRAGVRRSK